MADTGAGQPLAPVRHRGRTTSTRPWIIERISTLDPFDVLMVICYLGMITWGIVAQFEPPLTLIGAAGYILARIVTIVILVTATSGAVAVLMDRGTDQRTDVELPILFGFIGGWGTYVVTVWLLIAGLGDHGLIPPLKVFGVLAAVMLAPFIVRFVVLWRDAWRTIRLARRAAELGLVDEKWHTVR